MARILDPADFGVFIAVSVYTHLLLIFIRFGIPPALLQAKEINDKQVSTCFWLMQGFATISTGVVFLCANFLEQIYNDSRYSGIMQLSCITFFIIPYAVTCRTLIERDINYRPIAITRVISNLTAAPLSILLALATFGPYSLVLAGIISTAISGIFFGVITKWRPKLYFSLESSKNILRYSRNTCFINILSDFSERVDSMLVGALMSTSALGIYNRAYSLSRMPVEQLAFNLRSLLLVSLSRIQDDLEYTATIYKKSLCTMALAVFPFLLLFMVLAEDIIKVIYGPKWAASVEPLQIMVFGAFATMISINLRALSGAQNLLGKEIPIQITRVFLTAILVALAAPYGLNAVAVAIVIQEILYLIFLKRMIVGSGLGINWGQMFFAISPALIATLLALLSVLFTQQILSYNNIQITGFSHLVITSTVVLGTYVIAVLGLRKLWPGNELLIAAIDKFKSILRH